MALLRDDGDGDGKNGVDQGLLALAILTVHGSIKHCYNNFGTEFRCRSIHVTARQTDDISTSG
jgi:hypothetical protein